MTVIAVLELKLKPETAAEARPVLHKILEETRAFAGCEGLEVVIDQADPAHLFAVERWASPEADAAYREFRAGPGAITELGAFLAGPPNLLTGVIDPAV